MRHQKCPARSDLLRFPPDREELEEHLLRDILREVAVSEVKWASLSKVARASALARLEERYRRSALALKYPRAAFEVVDQSFLSAFGRPSR